MKPILIDLRFNLNTTQFCNDRDLTLDLNMPFNLNNQSNSMMGWFELTMLLGDLRVKLKVVMGFDWNGWIGFYIIIRWTLIGVNMSVNRSVVLFGWGRDDTIFGLE